VLFRQFAIFAGLPNPEAACQAACMPYKRTLAMTSVPSSIEQPSRPLTRNDYKTLSLSALGGALEFYDFIIFVFFATVVGKLFFPADMPEWLRLMQTFGIFAAGYLARPLGGIVMAHFGDLLGRKKMFTLSIFMMAVPTLIMGLLPTYAQIGLWAPILLLLMRVIQGAAIGGEVPGAWVFVSEHVPARNIGYACGTLTSGLTAGILLGSLVATRSTRCTPRKKWRITPGGSRSCSAVCSACSRCTCAAGCTKPRCSPRCSAQGPGRGVPLRAVLRDHRGAIILSMLLTWLLSAGIVVVILMTPACCRASTTSARPTRCKANSLAIVLLSLGCIAAGAWPTALARARVRDRQPAAAGQLLDLLPQPADPPDWLFPLYALTGLCVGTIGAVPYVMVKAFPPVVRFSGLSFSYNVAYAIFGGLTPMVVTAAAQGKPDGAGLLCGGAVCRRSGVGLSADQQTLKLRWHLAPALK
jgi:MFS family permease